MSVHGGLIPGHHSCALSLLMGEEENENARQPKNLPGTKAAQMWNWRARDFASYEGPLAITEYIQDCIRDDPADIEKIYQLPPETDSLTWQYEHLRSFVMEFNLLLVVPQLFKANRPFNLLVFRFWCPYFATPKGDHLLPGPN